MWELLLQFDWRPVFLIGWAISFFYVSSTHLAIWQDKDYRFDRFRAFLRTREGRSYLWNMQVWVKLLMLASIPVLLVLELLNQYFVLVIALLYVVQIATLVWQLVKKQLRRPVVTLRILGVILFELCIEGLLLMFSHISEVFFYIEILRPVFLALIMALSVPVMKGVQWALVRRAKKRLGRLDHVMVIGITGSFGKSTTKDFIRSLLESKFRVATPPRHIRTTLGIARWIGKHCTKESKIEVLLVEMDGYQPGEVKEICDLVHPRIGVLTGVNEQHLELFGDIEAIHRTKFELLQSLPKSGGLAILNGDIHYPSDLIMSLQVKKQIYSYDCEYADAYAEDIRGSAEGSQFQAHIAGASVPITLGVPGAHNVSNMLAALLVAKKLGVGTKAMTEIVSSVRPTPGTIGFHEGMKGALIIDDSYSANPDGFYGALDVFERVEGRRKILLTVGLMELGEQSDLIHYQLGKRIGQVVDECIVLREDILEPIADGIRDSGAYRTRLISIYSYPKLRSFLLNNVFEGDVVLIENRLPGNLRELLLEDISG